MMKEKGSILLLTQVIMFLVLTLGLTCIMLLPTEILLAKSHLKSSQAFYLAEAGVEDCLQNLAVDQAWQPKEEAIALGEGYYQIKTEKTDLGQNVLVSGWIPLEDKRQIMRRIRMEIRFWEVNALFQQAINENADWADDFQVSSENMLPENIEQDYKFFDREYLAAGDLRIAARVHLTGSGMIYVPGDLYLGEYTRAGMSDNDKLFFLVKGNVYTEHLTQIKGIVWAKGDIFLKRYAYLYGSLASGGRVEREKYSEVIYTMKTFYQHPLIFQPVFKVENYQYLGGGE